MSEPRYFAKHIFHPTDFSVGSEVAFGHALKLALKNKAELDIFHVDDKEHHSSLSDYPQVRSVLERWNELPENSSVKDMIQSGVWTRKIKAKDSDPVASILDYLQYKDIDLIVLATHQHKGIERWLKKSISEPLARQAKTLTLFIPYNSQGFVSLRDGSIQLKNILIPVDKSPSPQFAIETVYDFVNSLDCPETNHYVLHVGKEYDRPTIRTIEREQDNWEILTEEGHVAETIINTALEKKADLIVMATQGHNSFLDTLTGSTTEQVIREANCPVLAIPARFS